MRRIVRDKQNNTRLIIYLIKLTTSNVLLKLSNEIILQNTRQ